jgi:AcrR family transcriptional regulator
MGPGGTPPKRGGRSAASAARRADIIAAAIQVIARDGIRACTVTALEHETGFARGHFSYHFDSKEEIIALAFAAVGSDWATNQVESTAGSTAAERLEHGIRAAVAWAQRRPDYFRCLMNFRVEMLRDPSAFPLAPAIRGQMQGFTAQLIREATADGAFRPAAEPLTEARILFATVDGLLMHAMLDPGFAPAECLGDLVSGVVLDRLRGRR